MVKIIKDMLETVVIFIELGRAFLSDFFKDKNQNSDGKHF